MLSEICEVDGQNTSQYGLGPSPYLSILVLAFPFHRKLRAKPRPQAKNPLGKREGKTCFHVEDWSTKSSKSLFPGRDWKLANVSRLGCSIVSENSELSPPATQNRCARPPYF